jgi:hypothetical protein
VSYSTRRSKAFRPRGDKRARFSSVKRSLLVEDDDRCKAEVKVDGVPPPRRPNDANGGEDVNPSRDEWDNLVVALQDERSLWFLAGVPNDDAVLHKSKKETAMASLMLLLLLLAICRHDSLALS